MSDKTPLFTKADWDFPTLQRTYDAIEKIAREDLGLDIYPNQIEVVSSEQMLDAYSSVGLPLMYYHWSFGKHFVQSEQLYRTGRANLAYELVINSNPCIGFYMEENTMALQALVLAHAAFGHNHFFKNNYLFKQWTDAEGILSYLEFAKSFIGRCEEKYGRAGVGKKLGVEDVLDAAHALMDHGVFRYKRPAKMDLKREIRDREKRRREYKQLSYDDVIERTLPAKAGKSDPSEEEREWKERRERLHLPEENILYFIEKNALRLDEWQREMIRIVRNLAQYFYPQKQTKMMNEGCAVFVHHYILNALYDKGLLNDGTMLEVLHSHTNVLNQPSYDDKRFGGINPYALGFAMMRDIQRIVMGKDPSTGEPSTREQREEDKYWFPGIAECGDWRGVLKDAWANYRDESFIRQFLSPALMRKMRLFLITDEGTDASHVTVNKIHDERGYEILRGSLADSYELSRREPNIQVEDADMFRDRKLRLTHTMHDGVPLSEKDRNQTMGLIGRLWGYDVVLRGVDSKTGEKIYETSTIELRKQHEIET